MKKQKTSWRGTDPKKNQKKKTSNNELVMTP